MKQRGNMIVARGVFEHPVLCSPAEPFDRRSAWLWLVSEAAWSVRTVNINNSTISLARGELATSTRYLASRWQWDHSRARRFLDRLVNSKMIERRVDGGGEGVISVLRIVNYDAYQAPATRHTPDTPPDTGRDTPSGNGSACAAGGSGLFWTATDAPTDTGGNADPTQRQIQHIQSKKILAFPGVTKSNPLGWPLDGFDAWYAACPKKRKPNDARRAFERVRAACGLSFAEFMTRCEAHFAVWRSWPHDRRQFIPYPASFLNSGDYLEPPEGEPVANPGEAVAQPKRDPSTFTEEEWLTRLAGLRRDGSTWPVKYWGPAPGNPGCLVPAHLLKSAAYGGAHG